MSDRERWIVYPLIFFSFLMAARDKYVQPDRAEFRVLECQELHVVSDSGKSLINLYGSLDDAGVIVMYSHGQGGEPGDLPRLDPLDRQVTLGRPVVEIGADGYLGFLKLFGHDEQIDLKLGHERANRISGLYALDRDDELLKVKADAANDPKDVWGSVRTWVESDSLNSDEQPETDASETAGNDDRPQPESEPTAKVKEKVSSERLDSASD